MVEEIEDSTPVTREFDINEEIKINFMRVSQVASLSRDMIIMKAHNDRMIENPNQYISNYDFFIAGLGILLDESSQTNFPHELLVDSFNIAFTKLIAEEDKNPYEILDDNGNVVGRIPRNTELPMINADGSERHMASDSETVENVLNIFREAYNEFLNQVRDNCDIDEHTRFTLDALAKRTFDLYIDSFKATDQISEVDQLFSSVFDGSEILRTNQAIEGGTLVEEPEESNQFETMINYLFKRGINTYELQKKSVEYPDENIILNTCIIELNQELDQLYERRSWGEIIDNERLNILKREAKRLKKIQLQREIYKEREFLLKASAELLHIPFTPSRVELTDGYLKMNPLELKIEDINLDILCLQLLSNFSGYFLAQFTNSLYDLPENQRKRDISANIIDRFARNIDLVIGKVANHKLNGPEHILGLDIQALMAQETQDDLDFLDFDIEESNDPDLLNRFSVGLDDDTKPSNNYADV